MDHLEYSLGHLKQLWMFVNKPCRLKIHRETLYSRITGMSVKTHGGQILPCFGHADHGTQLRRAVQLGLVFPVFAWRIGKQIIYRLYWET